MTPDLEERASLLAQEDVTERLVWDGSPEPFKRRYREIAAMCPRLCGLLSIAGAARRYRRAETDNTPRLWRGKSLHELGNELTAQIERHGGPA